MFKECISDNKSDENLNCYVPTGNFATIERDENSEIPIILLKISEQDEKNLDKYECYPEIYYKKEIFAETENGEVVKTFTYIIPEEKFWKKH